MKNQKGFSVLEVIMSVSFLAGLIFVCTNIFKKQQSDMINAIQEIEITTVVNEMRMALRGREACTASFENKKVGSRDIKVIKKVIQYPETDEVEEVEAFPLYHYGRISFGDHQLKISSYTLEETTDSSDPIGENELNLVIEFNKNLPELKDQNLTQRRVKIYASLDNLGRIESCGLIKQVHNNKKFIVESGELVRTKGKIGIGTNHLPSRLSLEKGIQFLPARQTVCNKKDNGVIFFHKDWQALVFCYNSYPLKISNLGLKQ